MTPAEGFSNNTNTDKEDSVEDYKDDNIEALGDILSDAAILSLDLDKEIVLL